MADYFNKITKKSSELLSIIIIFHWLWDLTQKIELKTVKKHVKISWIFLTFDEKTTFSLPSEAFSAANQQFS